MAGWFLPMLAQTALGVGGNMLNHAMNAWFSGGSNSSNYGQSQSSGGSQAGSNDNVNQQSAAAANAFAAQSQQWQGNYNFRSMLTAMGYNTMGAIMQGIYNGISQKVAMQYNSAEAAKNRQWQQEMSSTAYQRAMEDMRAAGLNPILAYQQGGASTPNGSYASIGSSRMDAPSSSAASVSAMQGHMQAPSYYSNSWQQSSAYNMGQSVMQYYSDPFNSAASVKKGADKIIQKGKELGKEVKKDMQDYNKSVKNKAIAPTPSSVPLWLGMKAGARLRGNWKK